MPPLPPRSPIQAALNFGGEKYTSIPVPVLAIFACPHDWSPSFRTTRNGEQRDLPRIQRAARHEPKLSHAEF
jgi:hypothetical protein